jgi:hypothetical protein
MKTLDPQGLSRRPVAWLLKLLLLLAALVPSALPAQEQSPRAILRVLPGYELRRVQGIDTSVGELVKGDRVVLRYDIGPLAGEQLGTPEQKKGCVFYEEKVVHTQHARFCVEKGGYLKAMFVETYANFEGQPQGEQELKDVMAMLETYGEKRPAGQ